MFRPIFNPFMAAVAQALGGAKLNNGYEPRIKGAVSFSNMPRKPNPKYPKAHQGARECARRVAQMQRLAA